MCIINNETRNEALKHTLLQLTQTIKKLVEENDNELTRQIFQDFLEAKTIKEKVWIAEALQENI
jgi:hypothetical protein